MARRDRDRRIIFVSTMGGDPWGGSEELWSRTTLDLVAQGFPVSASVFERSPLHPRLLELQGCGVDLWLRPRQYSLRKHPWRWVFRSWRNAAAAVYPVERLIATRSPALVVFSDGGAFPPIQLLELCIGRRVPFATIGQANWEWAWPSDDVAERYRHAFAAALRCYFVSEANRRLAEKQIGAELANAEVVWNPVNLPFDASPPWPPVASDGELRLACVGRLHPPSKGQDILLEALAQPQWKERPWRLYLYGEGAMRQGLERLARKLGLSDRVVFAEFTAVEKIWAANHVLVMPSRYEGLPLTIVEAMLCARPVVATDVAGHAEIIKDGATGFLADAPTAGSMGAALERFWARRSEAEAIGKAASRRIRAMMPPNPVRVFSDKLIKVAGLVGPTCKCQCRPI
jgi:glycosyltransferase involved in cell wall biosynthesis